MIGNSQEIMNWLFAQDKDKQWEIKEHKKKRSLNANSYCWVLLQKLADKLNTTKEELYTKYIKEKGIFRTITINNDAVSTICHSWGNQGIGWLYEVITRGKTTTDLILYYGSSSYNTKQMANFVDYIVEECKEQDIEILTPQEIESLKENWK